MYIRRVYTLFSFPATGQGGSATEKQAEAAELEGVALNQLINVAVAEKVSEEYFQERGRCANRAETLRILERSAPRTPS